jgi:hypothetical protein
VYHNLLGLLSADGTRRNRFADVEFTVYNEHGEPIVIKGGYFITDGGYQPLSCFVNPNVNRNDRAAVVWSEFAESVRKDIECTNGIIKSRFRYFWYGVRSQKYYVINAAMETACILHNMLLILDGYDIGAWELNVDWSDITLDPSYWEVPLNEERPLGAVADELAVHEEIEAEDVNIAVPFAGLPGPDEEGAIAPQLAIHLGNRNNNQNVVRPAIVIPIAQPEVLRRYLITHFDVSYRLGRLQWPKSMQQRDRSRFRINRPVTGFSAIMRALAYINDALYVKESDYRREGRTPGNYVVSIGNGLFSMLPLRAGDVIADFVGEYITPAEARNRDDVGKGGYQVYINNNCVLDCYGFTDRCKASMANSPYKCKNISTNEMAVANAKLSIDNIRKKTRLIATKDIGPDNEIFWNYGRFYRYPILPLDS